jgi:polysaccharide export outer membrane protein
MKNHLKFLFILSIAILTSCRSSKDLIFLRDAANEEIMKSIPIQSIDRKLNIGDILYVSIKSVNPEINMLFNPEAGMQGGQGQSSDLNNKFATPSGAYLYGYEIDNEGNITLPMLGKIQVSGIAISQVESIVQKKADEFLKDALIKVKLLNYKVTVLGEVRSPGDYYNYNNSITVFQAIAMANGNTDYASIQKVMVVRPLPEGNKSYFLDLSSKDVYLSEAFFLQPNDYVFVQPDKNKNISLNTQAYSMILSGIAILLSTYGIFFN